MSAADTPFAPPGTEASPPPKGAPALLAGGATPSLGTLFQHTMDEFIANIGPYALAGLGFTVVLVPLVVVMILGIYLGLFGVIFAGVLGGIGLAQAVPEDAAGPVMLIVQLISMVGAFALMFAMIGAMNLVIAPMHASLLRAVRDQQTGGRKLDFMAVFRTFTTDLPAVLGATLLGTILAIVGVMMCYFPALIVAFLLVFTSPLVALHRMGAVASIRASAQHTLAKPGFHALFFLMYFGVSMLAAYIPVVGAMFALALLVRTHRELFGDGEEPVLT